MKIFIIEGKEPLLEGNAEEDQYIFEGAENESQTILDLTVKLRKNPAMQISMLINSK